MEAGSPLAYFSPVVSLLYMLEGVGTFISATLSLNGVLHLGYTYINVSFFQGASSMIRADGGGRDESIYKIGKANDKIFIIMQLFLLLVTPLVYTPLDYQ